MLTIEFRQNTRQHRRPKLEISVIVHVPVSVGELVDKITILKIKRERMRDPDKLRHVQAELVLLQSVIDGLGLRNLGPIQQELHAINDELWGIEDDIRIKEAAGVFDDGFVALARRVYVTNDRRAAVKKTINLSFGSEIIEEKSYA